MTEERLAEGLLSDQEIIRLYWERDEAAIEATDRVHGPGLRRLSLRLLEQREDAEECVNDTYLGAWNSIPPTRPLRLFAWLAKLCRNLCLNRLDWNRAQKRSAPVVELTRELEDCVPDRRAEEEADRRALAQLLERFLETQSPEKRRVFLRRYWYGESVAEVARSCRCSESKVKSILFRMRKQLKKVLEEEGIAL